VAADWHELMIPRRTLVVTQAQLCRSNLVQGDFKVSRGEGRLYRAEQLARRWLRRKCRASRSRWGVSWSPQTACTDLQTPATIDLRPTDDTAGIALGVLVRGGTAA